MIKRFLNHTYHNTWHLTCRIGVLHLVVMTKHMSRIVDLDAEKEAWNAIWQQRYDQLALIFGRLRDLVTANPHWLIRSREELLAFWTDPNVTLLLPPDVVRLAYDLSATQKRMQRMKN